MTGASPSPGITLPSPGKDFLAKVRWEHPNRPATYTWETRTMERYDSEGFVDTRGVGYPRDGGGKTWRLLESATQDSPAVERADSPAVERAVDPVMHPAHYTWIPGIECCDVTKHFSCMVGAAMAYQWRHLHKGNPIQDLEKAVECLQIEIRRLSDATKEGKETA